MPLNQIPPLNQWQDMGLGATPDEPEDWRLYGLPDFGIFSEQLGIVDCDGLGIGAEVKYELLEGPDGIVRLGARTPILEITPKDLRYIKRHGRPYNGMGAVGDTGTIYQYDGLNGFFSSVVGAAKSVVGKVHGAVKKVVSKIPGGKYLIKLGEKIHSIAKKFVAPLTAFVGKYATKLAPVAALIPGYGPAIAAGLYTAGKVANLMQQYGVKVTGKKGKARKLKFKSGKSSKKFQKKLKKAAKKEKKKMKLKGKGAYQASLKSALAAKKKGMSGVDFDYENLGVHPAVRRMRVGKRRAKRRAIQQKRRAAASVFPIRARRGPIRFREYSHLFPNIPPGMYRRQLIRKYLDANPWARR